MKSFRAHEIRVFDVKYDRCIGSSTHFSFAPLYGENMSYLLKLRGKVIVTGDTGAQEGLAQCVVCSEKEIEVEFDFEEGPCRWAGRLSRVGDFFCADELPTLTPDTVSSILLRARLFRNAFNEREWLLHGLWQEEGLEYVFDADFKAE